mmetsp:Transcript_15761/g.47464  ORF Transcript_15761/g.47464 Transcript_15761/m.47464 type:complete len:112 (-) Transcript_15761:238-573(-)
MTKSIDGGRAPPLQEGWPALALQAEPRGCLSPDRSTAAAARGARIGRLGASRSEQRRAAHVPSHDRLAPMAPGADTGGKHCHLNNSTVLPQLLLGARLRGRPPRRARPSRI